MHTVRGVKPGSFLYLLRFRAGLSLLLALAVYWPIALATHNETTLEVLRALQVSISSVVVASYFPAFVEILRKPFVNDEDQLILGIFIGWSSVAEQGIWALLWRLGGKPAFMYDTDLNGFFIWQALIGAVLHVTAPGAVDGVVPKRNWIFAGAGFGLGVLAGATMLAYRPNVAPVIEWLYRHAA